VRKGQTVHLTASLRKGMPHATCAVFSAVKDSSPSPHVEAKKLQIIQRDGPTMVQPTTLRLLAKLFPAREISLVADDDCRFYIMHEVDLKGDQLAKGRIRKDGRVSNLLASARGWFARKFG